MGTTYEDRLELSEETKKNIAKSEKEIREGKVVSLEDIKNHIVKSFNR